MDLVGRQFIRNLREIEKQERELDHLKEMKAFFSAIAIITVFFTVVMLLIFAW